MKYILTKISEPGWDFSTNHLNHIRLQLDSWICSLCKESVSYSLLDDNELEDIYTLLGTACGCEYIFDDGELNDIS